MRGFAFLMWGTGVSMKGSKQEEHWMCQRLVWKVLPPQCSQTLVFPIVSAVKFTLRCSKIWESFKQTNNCRQKRPTEEKVQNALNWAVQIELVKSKSSKENGKQCGGVLISHSEGVRRRNILQWRTQYRRAVQSPPWSEPLLSPMQDKSRRATRWPAEVPTQNWKSVWFSCLDI